MSSLSVFQLNPSLTFLVIHTLGIVSTVALSRTEYFLSIIIDNGSVIIASTGRASLAGSQKSEGCVFAFSSSRPLYTSGSTVLPPQTPGQPSVTWPCREYLAHAYLYAQAHPMTTAASTPQSTPSQVTKPASLQVSSKSRTLPTTLTDMQLARCYAGTGGSTVITISRGYVFPTPLTDATSTTSLKTSTMPCSKFFTIHAVSSPVRLSFQRSPICTSYAQMWNEENPNYGNAEIAYPPGVVNRFGYNLWACCGRLTYKPQQLRQLLVN